MKIDNRNYDLVFKYLIENNAAAKDVLSAILQEDIVLLEPLDDETIQKLARIVRHIGNVIMRHPDLLYVITMENFMETERLRDKKRLEDAEKATIEAKKAIKETKKAIKEAEKRSDFLKKENEKLRQQL
jgi:hypothetical protein